jgi:hypothetical protein
MKRFTYEIRGLYFRKIGYTTYDVQETDCTTFIPLSLPSGDVYRRQIANVSRLRTFLISLKVCQSLCAIAVAAPGINGCSQCPPARKSTILLSKGSVTYSNDVLNRARQYRLRGQNGNEISDSICFLFDFWNVPHITIEST